MLSSNLQSRTNTTQQLISAEVEISSDLSASSTIDGDITSTSSIENNEVSVSSRIKLEASNIPTYSGLYEFTPSSVEQTVSTINKKLTENIVIKPIPSNYGRIEFDGSTLSVI